MSFVDPSLADVRIERDRANRGYRLESVLFLPRRREKMFQFFADAYQLENITPPWLKFRVITPAPIRIAPGTIIDYRLRLHGVPIRWRSCISVWDPPFRFVDDQLRGPYRRWHHEHTFEEADGGTICRDVVEYAVPGGALIHSLFVRSDVRRIFHYRRESLEQRFGTRVLE